MLDRRQRLCHRRPWQRRGLRHQCGRGRRGDRGHTTSEHTTSGHTTSGHATYAGFTVWLAGAAPVTAHPHSYPLNIAPPHFPSPSRHGPSGSGHVPGHGDATSSPLNPLIRLDHRPTLTLHPRFALPQPLPRAHGTGHAYTTDCCTACHAVCGDGVRIAEAPGPAAAINTCIPHHFARRQLPAREQDATGQAAAGVLRAGGTACGGTAHSSSMTKLTSASIITPCNQLTTTTTTRAVHPPPPPPPRCQNNRAELYLRSTETDPSLPV